MTYVVRGQCVLAVWLLLILTLTVRPEEIPWLLFLPMLVLAVAMGVVDIGRVVGATGLTFRMSGPGQIVFYGFLVLFSPVVAQIYAMSSIARYFVDPGGPF